MQFKCCAGAMLLLWVVVAGGNSFLLTGPLAAQDTTYEPQVEPRSPDVEQAAAGFRVPAGMTVELVAAEPEVANPVAFSIDEKGAFYVCETFRQGQGVEDNRGHMYWLLDDLKAETVEDRRAYILKYHADQLQKYTTEHDRIRRLVDTTGDGRLDTATVFVTGFNDVVDGTGAGVLALDGDIYYTCIPKLWKFRDTLGDGVADHSRVLHDGFGVRFAFRGHDLHGLTLGPDGRIYFSLGDRGYHVTTAEETIEHRPDTGAVFRCERDGSGLEVFAYGLRNPQELAFDDAGNLFTADNNSDSGDRARWVYVCEGGDSGWRMYYQYPSDRGPWNRERMWYPYRSDEQTTASQPAYIVPPVAHISDGPSGLVAYYGVGLPARYNGHFFLADFRGQPANSGIRTFANRARGAGFELINSEEYLWSTLVTDVDFGYDGQMYFTDWVNGWTGLGKGRIFRCSPEDAALRAAGNEVAELFAGGFLTLSNDRLSELLQHADRRVRQRAQMELAGRGDVELLTTLSLAGRSLTESRHALWGLWEIARKSDDATRQAALEAVQALLESAEPELIEQACKILGDCRFVAAEKQIVALLSHPEPRVRYFAAQAVGRLEANGAIPKLLELLTDNNNSDPYLRHAAVMGLAGALRTDGAADEAAVTRLLHQSGAGSPAAQLGILLALRRLRHPGIAAFLTAGEPGLVLEAARAINDEPIPAAMPALAAVPLRSGQSDALQRRVLHANFSLGGVVHARRVAEFAAQTQAPESLRLEGLEMLLTWDQPEPLDRVTNRYRELPPRATEYLVDVVKPYLGAFMSGPGKVPTLAIELASKLGITDVVPELVRIAENSAEAPVLRVAAVQALDRISPDETREIVERLLTSSESALRAIAREILIAREPARAVALLRAALEEGSIREQQAALRILAQQSSPAAGELLRDWTARLADQTVPAALELEILQAAEKREDPAIRTELARYLRLRGSDPLAQFRECLEGGDAVRGSEVFFGSAAASCRRCHVVNGQGGGVGPDLSEVAKQNPRTHLLESIVLPDAKIAKGFESVLVVTVDGLVISGIVKEETAETLTLVKPLGEVVRIPIDDIEDRAPGKSGMPGDIAQQLTKSELRDLVEYLSTLQQKQDPAAHGDAASEQ